MDIGHCSSSIIQNIKHEYKSVFSISFTQHHPGATQTQVHSDRKDIGWIWSLDQQLLCCSK